MTRATTIGHRTALGVGALALTSAMLAPAAGAETAGVQGGNPEPGPVGGIGDPDVWGCFVGSTTQKDLKTEAGTLQAHNIVFALENGPTADEQIAEDRVEVTAVPRGAASEPVAVPFSYEGPVGTIWTTDVGEALGLEEGEQTSHVGEVDVTVTVDGTAELVATLDMSKGGTPVDHRCENTNTEDGPLWLQVTWTAVPMNMNDRGIRDGSGWAFTSDVIDWMPFRWQNDEATEVGSHYVHKDEVEFTEHTPSVFPMHWFDVDDMYGTSVSTQHGGENLNWIVAEGVGPDGKTYRRLSLIDPMKQETYDATLQGGVPVPGMTGEDRKQMELQQKVRETQPEDPNEPVPVDPIPEDPVPDPDPEEPAPDPEEPAPDPQPSPAPEKPAPEMPDDPEPGDDDAHEIPDKVETGPNATPYLAAGGLAALTGGVLLTLRRRFGIG